jgi:hypothetical protein
MFFWGIQMLRQKCACVALSIAPESQHPASASAASPFAAGEIVEVKLGRAWMRGKISRIIQASVSGRELQFDIVLKNGQRGILPANMIRKVPPNAKPN